MEFGMGGGTIEARRHGHPRFYELTAAEEKLHSDKNHDYAIGGDPLGNFRRVARILRMYPGLALADPAVVAMTYALKQLDAYLWLKSNGHIPKVEGVAGRLTDISVYAKLAQVLEEESTGVAERLSEPDRNSGAPVRL